MNYIFHIATIVALYIILAESLNLVAGFGGMMSLAHAAFYGFGAYASTLLIMEAGWPFVAATFAAVAGSAILGLVIALPSLRLKGDFFVLATLAFQMIIFSLLYNWVDLTRGPFGITAIPKPSVLGWTPVSPRAFLLLASISAMVILAIHRWLACSPYGRTLQAVRDDETAARALGKNVLWFKSTALAFSAGLAAIAGGLYAGYVTYIDPTSFGLDESVFILTAVVVGGAGNLRGPFVGAVLVVLIPEALRFLHISDAAAPSVRQIIYGLLLILMMRFRPSGIAGRYAFE